MGFLKPYAEQSYALMRIVVGLLFMQHGLQKIFGLFGGVPKEAPPVAFLCSGTMAVAYFMAHFPKGFFPLLNGGELAVLYCWIFFAIAAKGAGIWSVDAARSRA